MWVICGVHNDADWFLRQEFIIRTQRNGVGDTFVSRRYGDFKRLSDEVRQSLVTCQELMAFSFEWPSRITPYLLPRRRIKLFPLPHQLQLRSTAITIPYVLFTALLQYHLRRLLLALFRRLIPRIARLRLDRRLTSLEKRIA